MSSLSRRSLVWMFSAISCLCVERCLGSRYCRWHAQLPVLRPHLPCRIALKTFWAAWLHNRAIKAILHAESLSRACACPPVPTKTLLMIALLPVVAACSSCMRCDSEWSRSRCRRVRKAATFILVAWAMPLDSADLLLRPAASDWQSDLGPAMIDLIVLPAEPYLVPPLRSARYGRACAHSSHQNRVCRSELRYLERPSSSAGTVVAGQPFSVCFNALDQFGAPTRG
jgi:hypothetical protein